MTNLALIVSLMLGTQQLQCGGSDIGKTVRDSLFNEVVRQDRAADVAWLASFATKNAPPSWHAVVNKPELHFSFADTVYGALKVYDWTDLQK